MVVAGADKCGERNRLVGGIGNPSCDDAKSDIGLVPFESVETRDGGRMRILDAKGEARFAANYVHVERTDSEMQRKLVFVCFGAQSLWFCRSAGDKEIRRESPGWRIQRDGFAFEVKDGEMSGSGDEMDLVVRCGADGIVSRLEPF